MNPKHSKELRNKRQEAKKCLVQSKRILKSMETWLNSHDEHSIEMASAFFQIFKYHIEEGDLRPDEINLAAFIRKENSKTS